MTEIPDHLLRAPRHPEWWDPIASDYCPRCGLHGIPIGSDRPWITMACPDCDAGLIARIEAGEYE